MIPIEGKYSTAYIMVSDPNHVVEADEYKQILGFVNCHVFIRDSRIMPDYHYGKGCVIGFCMPLTPQVIPNIVGVDIGCNMMYTSFQKKLTFDRQQWLAVARQVRKRIPMAQKHRHKPIMNMADYNWQIASLQKDIFTSKLNKQFGTEFRGEDYTEKWFYDLCERVNCKPQVAVNSIGSLGGGNHFIEFSESEKTGCTGVTIHSGSRNLGLKIANFWQKRAKENLVQRYQVDFQNTIKEIKATQPQEKWDKLIKAAKNPPTPTGLEYLEGEDWYGYLHEMNFAQNYAQVNLNIMMQVILRMLNLKTTLVIHPDTVHTVHNYISMEDFIIRKGAVRSIKCSKMLIPFNMEDGILVCEGASNEEWYCSAPHGAGRLFGRGEMKRDDSIDVKEIRQRMQDKGLITDVLPKDEVKEAYKDPAFIEQAIAPTAVIRDRLRPIITLKADD